jgi:hypothetical protein
MKNTHKGVMVYEILPDGCLNGVGADTWSDTKNEIFNEMAKKVSDSTKGEILGTYKGVYTGLNGLLVETKLEISPSKEAHYSFNWYEGESRDKWNYEGLGWLTRPNQITVLYWYKWPK